VPPAIELEWPISTVNEGTKMSMFKAVLVFLRAMLIPNVHLAFENLALRQQLAVCRQSVKRPKLRPRDRLFWVWLSRLWPPWRSVLAIVQPETVIKWHRMGFKLIGGGSRRPANPGARPLNAKSVT
jgi:putative transposase